MLVKDIKGLVGLRPDENFGIVTISPDVAKELLKTNTSNRTLSKSSVRNFKRQIANGNWRLSPDCISFNDAGVLTNGQHRLQAVSEGNTPCEFSVLFGIDQSVVIDTGKRRSFKDIAGFSADLDDRLKGKNEVIEFIPTLIRLQPGAGKAGMKSDPNVQLRFVNRYADDFVKCCDAGLFDNHGNSKFKSPAIKSALFTIILIELLFN